MGTKRQCEILERLVEGKTQADDRELLLQTEWGRPDASICALGQTAALAVQSALKKWPHLFV
jgi:NADH-quinone oxidoreductase subunit F